MVNNANLYERRLKENENKSIEKRPGKAESGITRNQLEQG
jgi:hypothetical protein